MGYRNYISVVEKEKADAIRHKSYDELKDTTEGYIPVWDLKEQLSTINSQQRR